MKYQLMQSTGHETKKYTPPFSPFLSSAPFLFKLISSMDPPSVSIRYSANTLICPFWGKGGG